MPPSPRPNVDRRNQPTLADFDDQLWPVNLALLVLSGFIAGIIVAKGDFQTPLLLSNGWVQLGALGLIVGVLLWGVAKFGARVQRRVQLGVFISLLVHFWLCMLSYNVYLSMAAREEPDAAEQFEEPQIVTLPDYHRQDERHEAMVDEAIEAPVETELPEAESKPVEQARPEPTPIERPSELEPAARQREPSQVEMERAEMTTPHRSEQLSGKRITRSETPNRTAAEQVETPRVAEAPQRQPTMNDRVQAIERQAASANVERRETETPTASAAPRPLQLDRRQATTEPDAAQPARQPAPARQLADAPSPSPTRVEQPTSAPAERSAPSPLAPAATDVARQAASAANMATAKPSAAAEGANEVRPQAAATRRMPAPTTPSATGSQLERAAVARSQAASEAAPADAVPLESPTASAAGDATPLTPSLAAIERSAAGASAAAQSLPRMAARGEAGPPRAKPLAPTRAAGGEPTATASRTAPKFARAPSTAAADASAATVDSPAAPSAPASASTAQPAATGLTKATGGATGLTRQRNFDRELPGTGRLARTPSAAAPRAAASQNADPGQAAQPSEPARIAKARAGGQAPSAALPAEDVTAADAAGARRPERVEASASAAVERASAAAPRARISAARGAAPIDLSTPQVVSTIGEGRASGGGEPTLGETRAPARIAKAASSATAGGAALAKVEGGAGDPSAARSASSGPAGEPQAPGVGALARGEQNLPAGLSAGNPNSASAPGAAAVRAAGSPGEPRRAESLMSEPTFGQTPGQAAGQAAGVGRVAIARAAPVQGGVEQVELPAGTGEAAPSAATAQGNPVQNNPAPSAPASATGGAARQRASLPATNGLGANRLPPSADDAAIAARAAGATAALSAPRRGGETAEPGAALAAAQQGALGGALPRDRATGPAMATGADQVEASAIDDVSPSDGPSGADPLAAAADLPAGRLASAGVPVRIAAPVGPGGLSSQPAPDIGLPSRRARPESEVVHTTASRMIVERSGSKLAADVRVRDTAVPGLRQRDREMRRELARQRGGSESSERAVEMGLDFLARHQNADGSWSLHDFSQGQPGYENAGYGRMQSDTAATGLSMLAFLGAGYTHTDGKYRLAVGRGLSYLLGAQREDGDLFLPQDAKSNLNVWLYSHGIASIALGEAYGMTRDPALHDPAQRALDFIVAAQSPSEGGWRYAPRQGSDTSVSGWQLMALKSGELAGLNAPSETYRRVQTWLDGAQAPKNPALYVYRPKAKQDHQRLPSRVMTAEGLLMRQYLGWKRDNPFMVAGADYLQGDLPQWEGAGQRDAYYWYYATQVMFQIGGEHWQQWNDRLRSLLIEHQTPEGLLAGSWDPLGPSPDRWGREGGRLYVTAMHLLMLEVYYRHLPLYRNLEGEGAEEEAE